MRKRLVTAFLIVLLAFAAAACAAKPAAVAPGTPAPAATPGSGSTPASLTASLPETSVPPGVPKVRPMTIAEKRKLIAANFQPEVPVPLGKVVRGESQGDVSWDYELVVDAPVFAVAAWYRDIFTAREWQVVSETSPRAGAVTITMTKNAAQTRVTIAPADAGKSDVQAIVGVGAPVLRTQ